MQGSSWKSGFSENNRLKLFSLQSWCECGADAKFNNLVIYDREICMLRHTNEYYSLGHTLSSFQAHRAAFVSMGGTHCIRFELRVGFRSKFK